MTAGTKGVAQPCGERDADLATRLRQTERRLRELEQRYETVVGAIGESVYDWDIAGDRIVFYASMERAIGLPPEALKTARDWWDRIHPEDQPHYRTALIAHFKGDTPRFECDYRYRALDDSWRWARQNGLAMRDERGIAVRMMGATGEITELKERERLLAEKSAILETTLENMVQGISFIDGDLRTIAHNRRLREILEFPERFADGFALEEAFRLNAERGEYGPGDVEELVRARVELARRFEPHEFERTRPNGRVIAIRGQQLPGRRGFVTTYTDVTEQRRFEASLKRSEERYALATSAAVEGIYEWDVAAGTLFLTERAKEFFAADESMTPETWRARVHPDDWAGYHAAIVDHLKGRAPTLEHEYRIAAAGGAYRWVIDRGIGVRGVDGRVAKVVGALSDVTQRKEAEIELEARTRELTRSLDELNALGEVGRAVSSTLDLETVLSTIVSRATQLAGMDGGAIFEYDEAREEFWLHATHQMPEELVAALGAGPVRKGEGAIGRLAVTGMPVQIEDIVDRVDYRSDVREILLRSGRRSLLAVPLLREDRLLGGLIVTRKRAAEFAPQVVELLQAFATQSALAIHNARLFHEIERKRRELEAASRHKSEFLANMSHELRTPLNAIIGFSEVLAEGMFGEVNAKQAEYLGDILESGRHLLSLINDVLDLSKIEAGRMELEPSALDLPDTIENALTLVRERAMRRGIALVREVDPDVGTLHADARKVKQVLLNLLSNAIKFTPEGGRVEVRARIQGGEAEVLVADSGVGIAPEDQAAVFEEFRQVGAADKKTEGTGLGLAISRKFIELHGGRIWVTSEAGNGATFAFTLPLPAGSK